jgi:hypothetical protein
MYANTNSKHFKIRAILKNRDGFETRVPYEFFYPFGKYRSMSVLSFTLIEFMHEKTSKSEFILDDIAKRAERHCRKSRKFKRGTINKFIYQYCQNCNPEKQNEDWSDIYKVDIEC